MMNKYNIKKIIGFVFVLTILASCSESAYKYDEDFKLYMQRAHDLKVKNGVYLMLNLNCLSCIDEQIGTNIHKLPRPEGEDFHVMIANNKHKKVFKTGDLENSIFDFVHYDDKGVCKRYSLGFTKVMVCGYKDGKALFYENLITVKSGR